MTKDNIRGKILAETEAIINGKRNVDYGDPVQDFTTTAQFWETYLRRITARRGELKLSPHDVAAMMMLLKLARLTWTPNEKDHWKDAIGYGALGWECESRKDESSAKTKKGAK